MKPLMSIPRKGDDLGDVRGAYLLLLALFFLSGFAALLYQVTWQRMLAIFTGVDIYSVTLIVVAFMGGLGLGSMVGGYLSDRLSNRYRLLLFALSELTIAAFAIISKWLYYDVLYMKFNYLATSPVVMTLILFLSLLIPTFVMGITLPLLSNALSREIKKAAGTIGSLYGINTLGAAVGAFVTGWFLVRYFGFVQSLYIGAVLSFISAAGALYATYVMERSTAGFQNHIGDEDASGEIEEGLVVPGLSIPAWMGIYALSGFIALSLELVWFRLLSIIIRSNSFTFATLLTIYLAGLAIGTLVGTRLVKRSKRPARHFFMMQGAVTLYAGLSLVVLLSLLGSLTVFEPLRLHFAESEPVYLPSIFEALWNLLHFSGEKFIFEKTHILRFVLVFFVIPSALILPPTILMGLSFPFLQKAVQTDKKRLGRRVGWLQTANIAGSMAGATLVGVLSLKLLGSSGTLKLLIVLGAVYLFLLVYTRRSMNTAASGGGWLNSKGGYVVASAIFIAVLLLLPSTTTLWSKLHGAKAEMIVFEEDGSALTLGRAYKDRPDDGDIFVNGYSVSRFPYGSKHTLLGFIPAMLHPNPESVALIGLGTGETLFAIAGRADIKEIRSIEIIPQQKDLVERFNDTLYHSEAITQFMNDKRIIHVFDDGRSYLKQSDRKYDVIEADALMPFHAFSGNLYSLEFFELLKSRLKPGGFALTWAPTLRVMKTFVKAFPYVLSFDGSMLVGSKTPIDFNLEDIIRRADTPETREYYMLADMSVDSLLKASFFVNRTVYGPELDRDSIVDFNSDLHPKDEYLLP